MPSHGQCIKLEGIIVTSHCCSQTSVLSFSVMEHQTKNRISETNSHPQILSHYQINCVLCVTDSETMYLVAAARRGKEVSEWPTASHCDSFMLNTV